MNVIKENSIEISLLSQLDWNELAVEARAGKVLLLFASKELRHGLGILKNSSFWIRVNRLLHPWPSFVLYGLLSSLWCFSVLVYHYFRTSFNLKSILYVDRQTNSKYRDWAPLSKKREDVFRLLFGILSTNVLLKLVIFLIALILVHWRVWWVRRGTSSHKIVTTSSDW